jgi:hypothetical protein
MRLVAWPYQGLEGALSALPPGARVDVQPGPLHRDDLQPDAYALYAQYTAAACPPEVCTGAPLAAFANGVRLLAAETAAASGTLTLTLTWQATAALPAPVQVLALAVEAAGDPLAQADGPLGTALYPSPLWPAGAVVVERRGFVLQSLTVPAGLRVQVGLYDPQSLARVPRTDSEADVVDIAP